LDRYFLFSRGLILVLQNCQWVTLGDLLVLGLRVLLAGIHKCNLFHVDVIHVLVKVRL